MKKIFTVFGIFIFFSTAIAQQASDYFPEQTGFVWEYKVTPLDSLNNPVNSEAFFRIDTFAVVDNYEGRLANIIPTKMGPIETILIQPYTDSLFINTQGTNAFEYFSISRLEEFLIELDSLGLDPNFSFVDFFTSLQDWYSVYRFEAGVGSEHTYTLISVDTTILTYELRFKNEVTRLQDETIQTVLGSFDCKKFFAKWQVSTFLGPFEVPLIWIEDSIWIAQDNWIVQDIIPTKHFDLTLLGFGIVTIPGFETKLTDEIVKVESDESTPDNFVLEQNFPNPFNPSTRISYSIAENSFITLKVYDILGNEIATLINEEKPAGKYDVEFDANNFSSGIYVYRLQSGNIFETRKMILLK